MRCGSGSASSAMMRSRVSAAVRPSTMGRLCSKVYLFDFSGDLYGKTLDVALIGWLAASRGEIRQPRRAGGADECRCRPRPRRAEALGGAFPKLARSRANCFPRRDLPATPSPSKPSPVRHDRCKARLFRNPVPAADRISDAGGACPSASRSCSSAGRRTICGGKLREAGKGRRKFILHDGPPYANATSISAPRSTRS